MKQETMKLVTEAFEGGKLSEAAFLGCLNLVQAQESKHRGRPAGTKKVVKATKKAVKKVVKSKVAKKAKAKHRGPGRPKGIKNKRVKQVATKGKRGRPKGSKNKPKATVPAPVQTPAPVAPVETPKQ